MFIGQRHNIAKVRDTPGIQKYIAIILQKVTTKMLIYNNTVNVTVHTNNCSFEFFPVVWFRLPEQQILALLTSQAIAYNK